MSLFRTMTELKQYPGAISQFASNVSTEAILNKDSILYHEDHGYHSGFFGYVRPFSRTVYGDYRLVEALGSNNHSPLDVDLKVRRSWDAEQVQAYCRVVLITLGSGLTT